jgi:acyl carrier protein
MTDNKRDRVRAFLNSNRAPADVMEIKDSDSLFSSGRMDSLTTVNLIIFLEKNFGLDTSDPDFDPSVLDSIDEVITAIGEQ